MAKIALIDEDGDYWEGEEPPTSCLGCIFIIGIIIFIIYKLNS